MLGNLFKSVEFNRPIFLVGCSKSGTTIAGALFYLHPEINGGENILRKFGDVSDLSSLTHSSVFGPFATKMEYKGLWDKYFPMDLTTLRTGCELTLLENPLSQRIERKFKKELLKVQAGDRLFCKAPYNSFRVHVLRQMFPDCKIICIHRDGRDVISSWGREADSEGVTRWEKLGGYEKSIPVFARKWNETIDHIEQYKEELGIYTFLYEDLIKDTQSTLRDVFEFCELAFPADVYSGVSLEMQAGKWKSRIPEEFHEKVTELIGSNLKHLHYLD